MTQGLDSIGKLKDVDLNISQNVSENIPSKSQDPTKSSNESLAMIPGNVNITTTRTNMSENNDMFSHLQLCAHNNLPSSESILNQDGEAGISDPELDATVTLPSESLIDTSFEDSENQKSEVLTPYQSLLEIRKRYMSIPPPPPQAGINYFYIEPNWFQSFMTRDYDRNTFTFAMIGPLRTVHIGTCLDNLDLSFISFEQFKFLHDTFGIETDHQIIQRETVYSLTDQKLILDLNPLTIMPHIFSNNASQVNKFIYNKNSQSELNISTFNSLEDLYQRVLSVFDLNNTDLGNIRLWKIELESPNLPTVILPATLKNIKQKKIVELKENRVQTLKNFTSGHVMLEVRQNDGMFFLDFGSDVILSSGLVGLNNLGNTCFMNSALQCLMHIPELNSYFLYRYFEGELNRTNPLGNGGEVAQSFGALITSMFDKKYIGTQTSYAPRDFKYTIGHFNSMFSGYHQQDSQEFIAYLLDGLHEDLNRVITKPYVERPELAEGETQHDEAIMALAKKCWDAHKLRNNSVIVDLFVALYKSTLTCPECNKISITFDPYNDLTLPLPNNKTWSSKLSILPNKGLPFTVKAKVQMDMSYGDFKKYIGEHIGINPNDLIGVIVYRYAITTVFEDPKFDSEKTAISDLIPADEDIWFYEVPRENETSMLFPVYSVPKGNHYNNNFALPFIISLTDEDRLSYGKIQQKLNAKYSQLSKNEVFKNHADTEYGKYTFSDFKDTEGFMKYDGDSKDTLHYRSFVEQVERGLVEEDDVASMISYASPLSSTDELFVTKILDPTNGNDSVGSREITSPFFLPTVAKYIWKNDLPNLLDELPRLKRQLYLYKGQDMEGIKCNQRVDEKFTDKLDKDGYVDEAPKPHGEVMGESGLEKSCRFIGTTSGSNGSSEVDTTPESAEYITANEHSDTMSEVSRYGSPSLSPSSRSSDSSSASSYTTSSSSSSPSSSSRVPSSAVSISLLSNKNSNIGVTSYSKELRKEIIKPYVAIINEFEEDNYNACFAYNNTWVDLEFGIGKDLGEENESIENTSMKPLTLYDCLELFSKPEVLGSNDLWYCPACKEHRQATKKIELWSVPDILTIHLKRFKSYRSFSDKVDTTVEFPIEGLDLTFHVSGRDKGLIYDLFAVDNHFGGLGGGHYTSYVKNFVDGKWYYFDDSRVSPVDDPSEAIKGSAYLLFYRRRTETPLGGDFFENMASEVRKKREEVSKKLKEKLLRKNNSGNAIDSESSDEAPLNRTEEITENHLDVDDGNKRRKIKDNKEVQSVFCSSPRIENIRDDRDNNNGEGMGVNSYTKPIPYVFDGDKID